MIQLKPFEVTMIILLLIAMGGFMVENVIQNPVTYHNEDNTLTLYQDHTYTCIQPTGIDFSGTYEKNSTVLILIHDFGSFRFTKINRTAYLDPNGDIWYT